MPDVSQFRLPDVNTILPSNSQTYTAPPTAKSLRPVGPEGLVDGQGYCAGMTPPPAADAGTEGQNQSAAPAAAPVVRGGPVGLEMAECEVVRTLGPPQSVEISASPQGDRTVMMHYRGENSADYRFVSGRLVSLERGPEPPAPPKSAKKPAPKKKTAKKPPAT